MESLNEEKTYLDQKYCIIKYLGHGGSARVFLVEDIETKKVYAAKIREKEEPLSVRSFAREIKYLNLLQNVNCPYLIKMITHSKGKIVRGSRTTKDYEYIILEYAEKGELLNYIRFPGEGLGEELGRPIFYKILLGIKACHKANICHKDIKLDNILLGEKFEPKIADFGFATKIKSNGIVRALEETLGSKYYYPPEILNFQAYDGSKSDVFSLGVLLITLVAGNFGFEKASENDYCYRHIFNKNYEGYWKTVEGQISGLSPEFKDLFIKMVNYEPEERASIDDIEKKDEWIKKFSDLDENERNSLYIKAIKKLEERQNIVEKELNAIAAQKKNMDFDFVENSS